MKILRIPFLLIIAFAAASCGINHQYKSTLSSSTDAYNNTKLKAGNLTYTMPSSWQQVPPSNPMRLEEYVIDPTTQSTLAVHYFPRTSGTIETNITRWKNQFVQDDQFQELEKTQFNKDGIPVTIYHLTGTFLQKEDPMNPDSPSTSRPGFSMITLVAEIEDGMWFFKTTGPSNAIDGSRPKFDDLIRSFRVE